MSIIEAARLFATDAHGSINQKRKYSGEDYIVHPQQVASIVMDAGGTEDMVAAAWLHDVVEDTPITLESIILEFGETIGRLVDELTDKYTDKTVPRKERKSLELLRIEKVSREAQSIKIADIIANLSDFTMLDKKFAERYIEEKYRQYMILTKADKYLRDQLRIIIHTHLSI